MYLSPFVNLCKFLKYPLKVLGDPAYQKRVWINHEGKEVSDYDEATMLFLDSCEEMFSSKVSQEGMNTLIQETLQGLYDKISTFDDEIADNFPEGKENEMLHTPEWHEIQRLASSAYTTIKTNLKERGYDCEDL